MEFTMTVLQHVHLLLIVWLVLALFVIGYSLWWLYLKDLWTTE